MSHAEENNKVFHIFAEKIDRVKRSSTGFSIPMTEHTGLNLAMHINYDQAHKFMVDLQMAVLSWIACHGPQAVAMPKAEIVIEPHEWKMGFFRENDSIIIKIEDKNNQSFDINISSNEAIRLAADITEFSQNARKCTPQTIT